MQAKLRIKQFGPLKDIEVNLKNVNVFIGPQASGKSALAKIYTICKSPLAFVNKQLPFALTGNGEKKNTMVENFKNTLEEYNVSSFLQPDTFIEFDSELHYLKYENGELLYKRKLLQEIELLKKLWIPEADDKDGIADLLLIFWKKLFNFNIFFNSIPPLGSDVEVIDTKEKFIASFLRSNYTKENIHDIVANIAELEMFLEENATLYIPAERSFIAIIKNASLSLLNSNIPIPKHILSFGAEYEKASYAMPQIDLSFIEIGLKYINENGIDFLVINNNKKIKLIQAASGLQSIIPLLIPIFVEELLNGYKNKSFVIEEPELNLFPATQYDLIKMLEQKRRNSLNDLENWGVVHIYTTHSPFILSAFNNLLFADKVKTKIFDKLQDKGNDINNVQIAKEKIKTILPVFISPDIFSAYQLLNGTAESIVENGLIKENFIDETSDKLGEDFEALMDLMEQYK